MWSSVGLFLLVATLIQGEEDQVNTLEIYSYSLAVFKLKTLKTWQSGLWGWGLISKKCF
jgi:hypothetical protein